ncbi:MAG: VirB8/TrbF family protein [Alphaproteobacteria bacterium]
MSQPNVSDEQQRIAELIRSGEYFDEAKRWYQALYIGPISERTAFLIIAVLAVFVGLTGVGAVLGLLPVTERPPELLATDRIDDVTMQLVQIRPRGTDLNHAMLQFFLRSYVSAREGYDVYHYTQSYNFVAAHSDAPTSAAYAAQYGPGAAGGPVAQLGQLGRRAVNVYYVSINDKVEPKVAAVRFSTTSDTGDVPVTSQWTATIGFYYSDFLVTTTRDSRTGEFTTKTQEPQFQVVSYVLAPANAANGR